MKKLLIFVFFLVLLTGCNKDVSKVDYYKILDETLSNEDLTNTAKLGYKFYLPRGIVLINDEDFNQKFKYNSNSFYVYVDIVSYYYKKDQKYQAGNDGNIYFKTFEKNGLNGYIEINKYGDKYFLEVMYNYAKLEAYVSSQDLEMLLKYGGSILSSIEYNDYVIEDLISSDKIEANERSYDILKPRDKESNFLEYLQEYDVYYDDSNELPDEMGVNNELAE